MRKLIVSILLASAASSPALAQDHGRWHNADDQKENAAQAREARHEEHQQQQQQQQQRVAPQVEQRQQVQQWQGRGNFDGQRSNGGDFAARQRVMEQQQAVQQQQFDQARRSGFEARQREQTQQEQAERTYRGYSGGYAGQAVRVQQNQATGSWARDRGSWSHERDGDYRQRQVEQQSRDSSRWAQSGQQWNGSRYAGNWNRDWRNDRRYDWRRYRNSHRSIFQLGIYYDPFGYGYRSFDIGYRFQPAYFGQQYWIDPALYGLPYPPPGTQWVRYWNDAVLVDMYTGQVIDAIRDFFW